MLKGCMSLAHGARRSGMARLFYILHLRGRPSNLRLLILLLHTRRLFLIKSGLYDPTDLTVEPHKIPFEKGIPRHISCTFPFPLVYQLVLGKQFFNVIISIKQ